MVEICFFHHLKIETCVINRIDYLFCIGVLLNGFTFSKVAR